MASRKLVQELTRIMLQKSFQSLLNLEQKRLRPFAIKLKAQCTNMQDATCMHACNIAKNMQTVIGKRHANNR